MFVFATESRGREMAMRHISKVLADLMCDIEAKRAGAVTPAQIEAADQSGGYGQPPAQPFGGAAARIAQTVEGRTASNGMKEARSPGEVAGPSAGSVKQMGEIPAGSYRDHAILTLPVGRSIITARSSAALSKRLPTSAVVIDLAIERVLRHSRHANSPCKRAAAEA